MCIQPSPASLYYFEKSFKRCHDVIDDTPSALEVVYANNDVNWINKHVNNFSRVSTLLKQAYMNCFQTYHTYTTIPKMGTQLTHK